MTIQLVDGTRVTVAAQKLPDVMFSFKKEQVRKEPYNMNLGELKEIIEANPGLILKVPEVLREFKDNNLIEFCEFIAGLKIDKELKTKAGIGIKNVIVHNLDYQIVRALEIIAKYNTPPTLFRYDGALYKEVHVDIDRVEIRRRTAKQSEEDIKAILNDAGWNRVPKAVITSVVNGIYGIPITSSPQR